MQLFEVYETMKCTSFDRIKTTVHQATSMCCLVYCIVGFFGYLAFYNQTLSGNVLTNFSPSFANDAITIGFILSIACSFPLVIFPCRTALTSFLHPKGHHAEIAAYVPESKYQPMTLFIIFSTMILGILIPSVEVIISLVGSTIGVLVCVIFPATCFVKIMQRSSAEKTFAQIIIVIGFVVMILGTYANLSAMDAAKSGSHLEEKQSPVVESLIDHPKDLHNVPKIDDADDLRPLHADEKEEKVEIKLPDVKKDSTVIKEKEKPKTEAEVPKKIEPEVKISEDGIKKEEQEIAADSPISKDPQVEIQAKNEEIQELKDSKDKLEKEVLEMKEELVKQNKETQQLVLAKFDEIASKVDKMEKQSGPSAIEKTSADVESVKEPEKPVKIKEEDTPKDISKPLQDEPIKVESKEEEMKSIQDKPELEKESPKTNEKIETQEDVKMELKQVVKAEQKPLSVKTPNIETRVDPIVQLIKSQEPLSYQIGEKMMETKKTNASSVELLKLLDKNDEKHDSHEEVKNEMRKKREIFDDALNSLDPTLLNFELKSMISRDLKSVNDDQ